MLSDLEDVREAHLVEAITIGQADSKRLVLFVLVADLDAVERLDKGLSRRVAKLKKFRERLECQLITPDYPLLADIRNADCIVGWRD